MQWYPLLNFIVALALGALIGLEREYAASKKHGHDYAGIRTFPLITLFGAMAAFFGQIITVWIFVVSIIIMGALIVVAYISLNRASRKHVGATTEVAGFLAFFIGALCFYGEYSLAVIMTVAITVILFTRSMLHHFAEKIQPKELASTLKFAVIAFVILPFLPNKYYGPLNLFNPHTFWLMVVLVCGISFVGYILMKWFGEKGIELAGLLGGVISSTPLMISFAERSRKNGKIYRALALGVILASGIMFIRILVLLYVLNRQLFYGLLPAFTLLFVLTIIFSYFLWKRIKHQAAGEVKLDSPFTLKPALKFAFIFAAVLALVNLSDYYLASKGVYLASFFSGLVSMDAITVSLSNLSLSGSGVALSTAKKALLIATVTNLAVKGGIAYWFGGKAFMRIVLGFFAALMAVGILLIFLL